MGSQAQRERRERAAAARRAAQRAARRQHLMVRIGVIAGGLAVVLAIVVLIVLQRHPATTQPAAGPGTPGTAVDAAALPGLQAGDAPWPPEYDHLADRLPALDLPPNGNESFHIHAHLAVYADGQPVEVPANIGFRDFEVPMHTHDTRGVIHIEASQPSPAFTLGAFFDVWGVLFTDTQLGGYHTSGDKAVNAYVNGKKVTDPARYVLRSHDDIVVGYGNPESFPHTSDFAWPAGE